jgi:predicted Rdx family selenoprotein
MARVDQRRPARSEVLSRVVMSKISGDVNVGPGVGGSFEIRIAGTSAHRDRADGSVEVSADAYPGRYRRQRSRDVLGELAQAHGRRQRPDSSATCPAIRAGIRRDERTGVAEAEGGRERIVDTAGSDVGVGMRDNQGALSADQSLDDAALG